MATPRGIDSSIFLLPERLKAHVEMSADGREEGKERKKAGEQEGRDQSGEEDGESRGLGVRAVFEVDHGGLGFNWVELRPAWIEQG